MTDSLYRTRLRWSDIGHGVAICDGVTVELRHRPPVLRHIARIVDLEYAPQLAVQYVQTPTDSRRDLEPGEGKELAAWLQALAAAARACVDPAWS